MAFLALTLIYGSNRCRLFITVSSHEGIQKCEPTGMMGCPVNVDGASFLRRRVSKSVMAGLIRTIRKAVSTIVMVEWWFFALLRMATVLKKS